MLNIIGYRKTYLTISALLVLIALISIATFSFKPAIDFTGGSLWQFSITGETNLEKVQNSLVTELQGIENNPTLIYGSQDNFILRTKALSEEQHQKIQTSLKNIYPSFEELSFESIGPSIGEKLKKNAIAAVVLAVVIVSLYIAYAFRKVSRPISSWKYGIVTMITLLHDIAIPAGLIAILGKYLGVEIDTNFIVALLVVMGFSVHDTIVVFDRIRENLILAQGKIDFAETINKSINQTLARSINTSFTLILVLVALYLFGPDHLKYFILTLLVGVIAGVYSSIFVASPSLYLWHQSKKS